MKFSSWSKNITITKILATTKKQKLFNEEDSILFIDSTIIQASPNTKKIKIIKNSTLIVKKEVLTTKLYLFCTSSCLAFFRLSFGNSRNTHEIKLIKFIYSKNKNSLLMDKAYKSDKTLALAKVYGFHTVVPPKKNHKSTWLYDKQLYKSRNNIERYCP